MKTIFFGTPPFAAHLLQYLMKHRPQEVLAVVTRPDRPKGRLQKMQPSAVKELCVENYPKLPLFQPEKASSDSFAKILRELDPDLFIVVAYGEIIKQNLLDIPHRLPINVHASLLPKYRGAAPIQRAIMEGETETGITIMEMVLEMDAGPILEMASLPIGEEMTFGELEAELCQLAGPTLMRTLEKLDRNELAKTEQDASKATFAPKISLDDRAIDWSMSCEAIHNQVRGLSPLPGAFCLVKQDDSIKRLGIKRTRARPELKGTPAETLSLGEGEWVVACGAGALSLLQVQIEGKTVLDVSDFLRGVSRVPVFLHNSC